MANLIIDPKYNINIYLDTNILVDYIRGEFPLLNSSIEYLSKKEVVNLKSSHFILYEYTEARKYQLFLEHLIRDGYSSICVNDEGNAITKAYVKSKNWIIGGKDYSDYAQEIQNEVIRELEHLHNDLSLDFDENVLHEGLVTPSNDLCLSTKISKEDCLVMVSCVYPNIGYKLTQCLILSRDQQYFTAFNQNQETTNAFFRRHELNTPTLLYTENLTHSSGRKFNLYINNPIKDEVIQDFWDEILRERIKIILGDNYIGETYAFGNKGVSAECIYFRMKKDDFPIKKTEGLFFLSRDLTRRFSVPGPFVFWNDGHPIQNYPFANPEFPKFSFKPSQDLPQDILNTLRKNGLLVFYDDI